MLMIESTVINYASDALVLAITPDDHLSPKEKKEKEDQIIRRNRIFKRLENAPQLSSENKKIISEQLHVLRTFFGEKETFDDPSRSFGFFAKTIDETIVSKTVHSLNVGGETVTKNEELRNKILQTALAKAKAKAPEVLRRLEDLFQALDVHVSDCSQATYNNRS